MHWKLLFVVALGCMLVCPAPAEDRIESWLSAIDGSDEETRVAAIDRLGSHNWSTESPQAAAVRARLEPLLQDADPKVCQAATYAYMAMGGRPELVEPLLQHSDMRVATSAAKALLAYTDRVEQPVATLVKAYAQPHFEAMTAFGQLSPALTLPVMHELLSLAEKDPDEHEPVDELPLRQVPWIILSTYFVMDAAHAPRLLILSESTNRFHVMMATMLMGGDLAQLPEVQVAFARLLNHSDKEVRQLAAIGLLTTQPSDIRAWSVIREQLRSSDDEVSLSAAIALGDSGVNGRPVLAELFHGLLHEDRQYRVYFRDPLENVGPTVIPELLRFVVEQEDAKRFPKEAWEQVFWVLAHFGPAAASALPAIERHVELGGQQAIETLCKVGRDDQRLLAACLRVLKHEEERDLKTLIESLLETLPMVAAVREPLRIALREISKVSDPMVRVDALRLRQQLGEAPEAIVQELIMELAKSGKENNKFAFNVLSLLKELGPAAAPAFHGQLDQWLATFPKDSSGSLSMALAAVGVDAVPFWIEKLKDENEVVRDQACQALGELGPQASGAVEALAELLDDEAVPRPEYMDPVWLNAAWALGKIGPSARSTLPRLWERLDAPHQHAASYVLGAIARIGGPADELLPRIEPYFDHNDASLNAKAVEIAIRVAPERPETWRVASDYIRRVRHNGLRTEMFDLDSIGVDDVLQTLVDQPDVGHHAIPELQRLFNAPFLDGKLRCEAAYALVKLDPQNPQPLDYLQRLSQRRDFDQRYEAERALEKLGIPKSANQR